MFVDTFGVFGAECGHVPIRLRSIAGARILWLNRGLMRLDPAFTRLRSDEIAYRDHLLTSCAYQIVDASSPALAMGAHETLGIADRYGGNGIGRNGGSGRNALVNDYFVKGIGRTPLVSRLTPLSHASGGAYLEEAVRETIYAEIVGREFPHGAVPNLAIIDTRIDQNWPEGISPRRERRVLIVRPPFVRPAHFERAVGFISYDVKEGASDHARVSAVFTAAKRGIGEAALMDRLFTFFQRWTEQLAFGFVYRWPHGNNTSSNIALDGRLVDFGASSAVPSWALTATSLMPDPFDQRFEPIARAIKSLCYYFGRHVDPRLASPKRIDATIEANRALFSRYVCIESLKLCGVSSAAALNALNSKRSEEIQKCIMATIHYYQATYLDFVEDVAYQSARRATWDLADLWLRAPPAHLANLAKLSKELVPVSQRDIAAAHCRHQTRSRHALYAPSMRKDFFDEIASHGLSEVTLEPDQIQRWIDGRLREPS
jgi:hypothetical protein